jgi:hypothetical protein
LKEPKISPEKEKFLENLICHAERQLRFRFGESLIGNFKEFKSIQHLLLMICRPEIDRPISTAIDLLLLDEPHRNTLLKYYFALESPILEGY